MDLTALETPARGEASLLAQALEDLLGCPNCHEALALRSDSAALSCAVCRREFPVVEGIPIFLSGDPPDQGEERRFRDTSAVARQASGPADLLRAVGSYHCRPIMGPCARRFRASFGPEDWILDLGTGYGWPWAFAPDGGRVIGVDISLGNLRLARRLLAGRGTRALLVCASGAALPLRRAAVAGVWSAQVLQHMPARILRAACSELDRVMREDFRMELHNLNPAPLHRFLCGLLGRRFHTRGSVGPWETNRLTGAEWLDELRTVRSGRFRASVGYSELFFHPELHLRIWPYPVRLEHWLAERFPAFSGAIARQVCLRITGGMG